MFDTKAQELISKVREWKAASRSELQVIIFELERLCARIEDLEGRLRGTEAKNRRLELASEQAIKVLTNK